MSDDLLVDILLDSGTLKYSMRDKYVNGSFYQGDIVSEFPVTENFFDTFFGIEETEDITIELTNIDDGIDDTWDDRLATEELRGRQVLIRRENLTLVASGKISDCSIGDVVSITVELRNDELLETLIPYGVVTVSGFAATAKDVGVAVPILFGRCKNIPLANIQTNYTSDYYDYLIGYGPIESLWIDHENNRGIKRNGVLVDESEYTFYDGSQGSPYPGYAFIRFVLEQVDFNTTPYAITADVYGLELGGSEADRNFANVIKALLSNSTWGLGDSVNDASFATAATALSTTYWMCDGAVTDQVQSQDVLNDLLFICHSSIKRNANNEWEINVDGTGSSVADFGENDGYYENCDIEEVAVTPSAKAIKDAIIHYDLFAKDSGQKEISLSVHSGFGADKTYELPFVTEDVTAKKILSYIYGRATHADKTITMRADSDAMNLVCGNIITVTSPRRNLSSVEHKIISVSKMITEYTLVCERYNSSIFDDQSISEPTVVSGTFTTRTLRTIDDGTIGGLTVTGTSIVTSDGVVGLSSEVTGGTDIRIWAGDAVPADAPFQVDENGVLTATGADISGLIVADDGEIAGWEITPTTLQKLASLAGVILDSSIPKIAVTDGTYDRVVMGKSGGIYTLQVNDDAGDILFDISSDYNVPYLANYADSKAIELELMKINFQNISWAQFAVYDGFDDESKREDPDPSTYDALVYRGYLSQGGAVADRAYGFVSQVYEDITTVDSGTSSSVGAGFLEDSSKSWYTNEVKNLTLVDSLSATFNVISNTGVRLTVSGTPAAGAYSLIDADPSYAVAFCSLSDSSNGGTGTVKMEVSFDGGSNYQTFYETSVTDLRQGTVEIDDPGTDYIVRFTLTNDGSGNGAIVYKFLVCTDPSCWRF